jgi:hypothetical protein
MGMNSGPCLYGGYWRPVPMIETLFEVSIIAAMVFSARGVVKERQCHIRLRLVF